MIKVRPNYLLRLDDACPTMYHEKWDKIITICRNFKIKPIIGVVPLNKDKQLMCRPIDTLFWKKVRNWDKEGMTIALHGTHHKYHSIEKRDSIIPLSTKSEFTGVSKRAQIKLIREGWNELISNGIVSPIFMAPSHSFDFNTLSALRQETSIRLITDGYFFSNYSIKDFTFIPQQIWKFRWFPYGLWTVCLHPNTMSDIQIEHFKNDLAVFKEFIIGLENAIQLPSTKYRGLSKSFIKIAQLTWPELIRLKNLF